VIRPVADADARAIAELEVRAWRWAYVDIVAEEDMIAVEDRVARWARAEGAHVAEVEGRIAGLVQVQDGELKALHVEPAAQGAGLGTLLHDFACERLRAAGHAEAVLWVFEGNGHARGFFEHRGWERDGVERETLPGVTEIRYRRAL
jgi:GNAT superfamily N-acetyltransferase